MFYSPELSDDNLWMSALNRRRQNLSLSLLFQIVEKNVAFLEQMAALERIVFSGRW